MSKKVTIFYFLFLVFLFVNNFSSDYSIKAIKVQTLEDINDTIESNSLKISDFWSEDKISFIHITGANWTQTNQTYDWCNGKGTKDEPYIIENVTINGKQSRSCILIENSKNVYFIIKNCTVYNSSIGTWPSYDGGIKLVSTQNGTLIDNNCSYNPRGIVLHYSNHNTVENNTITHNSDGIHFFHGDDNNITGNEIYRNTDDGIWLYYSDNNIVSENDISDKNADGMYLEKYCFNNEIINNNITNNRGHGIHFWDGNRGFRVRHNNINYNDGHGIFYDHDNGNSVISNNIITNNSDGIHIDKEDGSDIPDHYLNITANVIENNIQDGIELENANQTTIKHNTILGCIGYGVKIGTSDSANNFIFNNTFKQNGIHALDLGVNNDWNSTKLGNYWDNYTGKDRDDDGIGEEPFNISRSPLIQDFYPIWDDGHNGSVIFINDNGLVWNDWAWANTRTWCSGSGTFDHPYVINNLVIDAKGIGACVKIENSEVHFIINNCTLKNSGSTLEDGGIHLKQVNNGTLINNNCSNNKRNGIYLESCEKIIVSDNTLNNNSDSGLFIIHSNYSTFTGNSAKNNTLHGIYIEYCEHNLFLVNSIHNNSLIGIYLCSSDYNNFSGNYIYENVKIGIFVDDVDFNSDNNLFYCNWFIQNGINAKDNGTNNKWDNGTIGNYWHDYTGCDANDDGIGELPYYISGDAMAMDNFPICSVKCSPPSNGGSGGGGGGGGDSSDAGVIPLGNFYLLFIAIAGISILLYTKRKINIHKF